VNGGAFPFDEKFRPVQRESGVWRNLSLTPVHMSATRQFASHRDHKEPSEYYRRSFKPHSSTILRISFLCWVRFWGYLVAPEGCTRRSLAQSRAVELLRLFFVQNDIEKATGYFPMVQGSMFQ
jgi:hypothetical protein